MNGIVCGLFFVLFSGPASATIRLQERYNWRQLDWVFPNQAVRDRAIASGDYIPTNGLPVGIERWQNKLFVSVPRWRNGQWRKKKTAKLVWQSLIELHFLLRNVKCNELRFVHVKRPNGLYETEEKFVVWRQFNVIIQFAVANNVAIDDAKMA